MLIGTQAAFAPADRAALKAAVGSCTGSGWNGNSYNSYSCTGGCLGETPDGSCPTFAASHATPGNPYGVIGDWDVSAVTDMDYSKCTLSLPQCGHGAFRRGVLLNNIRQLEVRRITSLTRVVLFVCLWFETVPFLLFVVGWSFFFVAASLIAVFSQASAFNQDVSNWNTGAVTTMLDSKCTLSLSVATPSAVVFVEYTLTRVLSDHNSHTFCCFVVLKRYLFCCLWWVGHVFFFVAPSLAVFWSASVFNKDVSKWNTGAVTYMRGSKCILSPSLWPRRCCVF